MASPVEIGSHDEPGLRVTDVSGVGGLAYVVASNAGLLAIDVSDPTTPVVVGSIDTPGYARGLSLAGGVAYVADDVGGLCVAF